MLNYTILDEAAHAQRIASLLDNRVYIHVYIHVYIYSDRRPSGVHAPQLREIPPVAFFRSAQVRAYDDGA